MNDEKLNMNSEAVTSDTVKRKSHADDSRYTLREVQYSKEYVGNEVKKIKRVKYAVKDGDRTNKYKQNYTKKMFPHRERKALVSLVMVSIFVLALLVPVIIFLISSFGNYLAGY